MKIRYKKADSRHIYSSVERAGRVMTGQLHCARTTRRFSTWSGSSTRRGSRHWLPRRRVPLQRHSRMKPVARNRMQTASHARTQAARKPSTVASNYM